MDWSVENIVFHFLVWSIPRPRWSCRLAANSVHLIWVFADFHFYDCHLLTVSIDVWHYVDLWSLFCFDLSRSIGSFCSIGRINCAHFSTRRRSNSIRSRTVCFFFDFSVRMSCFVCWSALWCCHFHRSNCCRSIRCQPETVGGYRFGFSLACHSTAPSTCRHRPHSLMPDSRTDRHPHCEATGKHDWPSGWIWCALLSKRSKVTVDRFSCKWSALSYGRRPGSRTAANFSVGWILCIVRKEREGRKR